MTAAELGNNLVARAAAGNVEVMHHVNNKEVEIEMIMDLEEEAEVHKDELVQLQLHRMIMHLAAAVAGKDKVRSVEQHHKLKNLIKDHLTQKRKKITNQKPL